MMKLEYKIYADSIHAICLSLTLMLFKAGNETVPHLSHQIQHYDTFCFETMLKYIYLQRSHCHSNMSDKCMHF